VFTLNVDGETVSFTYWDYENNFQSPDIKDIYQQAREQLGKKLSPEQIKAVARSVFKSFKSGVAEGSDNDFEQAHHNEVERYITAYGTPGEYRHKYDAMGRAHNSYLTYPGRTVTINTQQYGDRFGHNVFTKKQGVAEAIPYALSAANANAEFERTKTHVPQGYRGRVDAEVSSREEYQDVMIALKKAAQEEGQHVECGLSGNQMSIFSKTMDSDELDEFVDNVLSDGLTEGKMSEVDQIIRDIVSGDMDAYTVMTRPQSDTEQHVAQILEREYEEVARSHRLHPDDDFEQILDIVVDNLAQDYGVNELDEAQPEKIAGRYEPDEFDQMVLRLKQKAKEQERKHGPVDLNALAKRLRGIEQDGRTTKGS